MLPLLLISPSQETFPGYADSAFVQGTATGGTLTSFPLTIVSPGSVTAGNLLVCPITLSSDTAVITDVTSTRTTGSWTRYARVQDPYNSNWVETWGAFATSSGSCTVTVAGTP